MNRSPPDFVQETGKVVQDMVQAVLLEDHPTVQRALCPDSDVDLAYRLFGLLPLTVLLRVHLGHDTMVMPRFSRSRADPDDVRVELGWMLWLDPDGKPVYDAENVSTVYLRPYQEAWRVTEINPAPLDEPITVHQARLSLRERQAQEQETTDWLPYELITGMVTPRYLNVEELDDVEQTFVPGMQERGFGLFEVTRAVRLWRDYKKKARPRYRKPGVYAATVEYIMQLLGYYQGTQEEIARYYGVSVGAVGAKVSDIELALGLHQHDERYSVHLDEDTKTMLALLKQVGGQIPHIPLGGIQQDRKPE